MSTIYRATCADCGWTGQGSKTEGLADWALRRHSCDRQRELAARQVRKATRYDYVDRTPKPCLHKEADHQHGTYACYTLDACRCAPCCQAVHEYEQNRVRQHAYGRWNGLVDAEPAKAHVRALTAAGMGLKRISEVSGVPHGSLWKLMYGKRRADGTMIASRRVRPSTADRLLAVKLELADGAKVDPTGAVRRLRALVALGWSQSKITARLGMPLGSLNQLVLGKRGQILVSTDKAVRALYDEWSMTLPPAQEWRDKIAANRSRNYAKARGWLPPLAWDDEALDNPDATPLTGAASTNGPPSRWWCSPPAATWC
jgi:transcriptional regulator with XRE-family HTH domain